ncbi:MAG: ParB/RepB/Spo0J family partition protein [Candidatus Saccharimonas sp.]
MSGKKKGLGRGFASLIPTELLDESFDPTAEQDERVSDLRHIKLSEVVADPDQPRRHFDEVAIEELAASITEHGILQPIVVTPHDGIYMIVAGERRYRAAERAGLDRIPALVRTLTDQHKLELSLIENLQRRDLNPIETATAYLKLRDQFNLTLEQIGERVGGKSVSGVSNTLRILRLPEVARKAIAEGRITEGQARPLVSLDVELVESVLPQIIENDWSARMIEQYVSRIKREGADQKVEAKKESAHQFVAETKRLEKRLGATVKIHSTKRGAGKIVIVFKNADELEDLAKKIAQ